ncbi:hypothetical protein ACLF3G_02400 [Falsiroseomonas sp. HC035]|uniref:hypothetical protein n=1 Tax=Falsiroseomonas sp. HC035 TaxID=3390999 RepID=UPI003D323097
MTIGAQPALSQQWPVAPPQPRPVGSLTAHCGGGVTGGGGGTRIMADGAVTRLEQPRAGVPLVHTPLGRDWEAYQRWVAALEAAGFARLAENRPGNVTCSLTQEVGGRLVGVSWPGEAPPSRIPAAVRQVFMELRGWSPQE